MVVAAVPVKDLANAKQRLVGALGPEARAALARAMLCDVLRALGTARLDRIWVVTHDAGAAAVARAFGVDVLPEPANHGHTAAVARAQAEAERVRAGVFLTVPGDVPCVTAAEIGALVDDGRAGDRMAVFAPSRSGLGTNGAVLAPPGLMPLTFGEPSFQNHLEAARRLGLAPRVRTLRGLGLDIDTPDDLDALAVEGAATESGRLVGGWRLARR